MTGLGGQRTALRRRPQGEPPPEGSPVPASPSRSPPGSCRLEGAQVVSGAGPPHAAPPPTIPASAPSAAAGLGWPSCLGTCWETPPTVPFVGDSPHSVCLSPPNSEGTQPSPLTRPPLEPVTSSYASALCPGCQWVVRSPAHGPLLGLAASACVRYVPLRTTRLRSQPPLCRLPPLPAPPTPAASSLDHTRDPLAQLPDHPRLGAQGLGPAHQPPGPSRPSLLPFPNLRSSSQGRGHSNCW